MCGLPKLLCIMTHPGGDKGTQKTDCEKSSFHEKGPSPEPMLTQNSTIAHLTLTKDPQHGVCALTTGETWKTFSVQGWGYNANYS